MELSYKALKEEIENSKIPLFIECWASWCLPCKQYDSMLEDLASKYADRCKIYKINVDRNPKMSKDYEIRGLPQFLTFYCGRMASRKVGAQTIESLRLMIEELLSMEITDSDSIETMNTNGIEDEEMIIEHRLRDLGYL